MYYNVAQLLKEPVGSTRIYELSELLPSDDGSIPMLSEGRLSLMRTDRGIWASTHVEVRLSIPCSRCLKGFLCPLDLAIEEEFLPTVDINSGQSIHVSERADGSFTIDRRHGIDLKEVLRQYSLTNQPMKPLCRQECLGLCLTCGADRNEVLCSCEENSSDVAWSPLTRLLQEGVIDAERLLGID